MLIVHVHVQVKPECIEAFKVASLDNARLSVQEPGIARFDVVQQTDDPTRFIASPRSRVCSLQIPVPPLTMVCSGCGNSARS